MARRVFDKEIHQNRGRIWQPSDFPCNTSVRHFGQFSKLGGWYEGQGVRFKFIKVSFAYMLHSALHEWLVIYSIKSGKNVPASSIPM